MKSPILKTGARLVALVAALLVFFGCEPRAGAGGEGGPSSNSFKTEITDPQRLSALWSDYILPAILDLRNSFDTAEALAPEETATFAFQRYYAENGGEGLESAVVPAGEGWDREQEVSLWPLDEAAKWVERYFDLKIDDPEGYFSKIQLKNYNGPVYSPSNHAIAFILEGGRNSGEGYGYQDENPWGVELGGVLESPDGGLTITVNSPVNGAPQYVDHSQTYTLGKREEGVYYFKSGVLQSFDNGLANLSGDYQKLKLTEEESGFLFNSSMVGETQDSFFLSFTEWPGSEKAVSHIWRIEKSTGEISARLDQEVRIDPDVYTQPRLRNTGDGFLLMDAEQVFCYDYALRPTGVVALPSAIRENMVLEYSGQTATRFFSGYDMTKDASAFYYSNEKGLSRYADGEETLLVEAKMSADKPLEGAIQSPQQICLVDGEQKLVYLIFGYEWLESAVCLDLATGEKSEMPVSYMLQLENAGFAPGRLSVQNDGGTSISYYDFKTGRLTTAPVKLPEGFDSFVAQFDPSCVVGASYGAACLRMPMDAQKPENGVIFCRFHLPELTAEALNFGIDPLFAQTNLLGVLSDGRIILSYRVNQAESGVLIVG